MALYSLDCFRLLRPARCALTITLGLGIEVGEVLVHLGEVLTFEVSSWLTYGTARAVRRVLREELLGHRHLARGVGSSIATLSYCIEAESSTSGMQVSWRDYQATSSLNAYCQQAESHPAPDAEANSS